ncbi:hypothetical protein CVS40_4945 [Lucilia cuprina]|nr:hypothetical protein CVS40_4945 [Lucilia cuprina]
MTFFSVHIKLHMSSGQRKRAQQQLHHKKRHIPPPSSSHNQPHHHHHQHSHPLPPPPATTNLYHESPPNYLTGHNSINKYPSSSSSSSSSLHLHESGQLLNMDEELFGHGDDVGGDGGGGSVVTTDADTGEHMMIPSYLAKNFALFPQPTTTYETEIVPHNSEGFNVVDGLEDIEEDNEIRGPTGRVAGSLESIMLAEQMENYQRHKTSAAAKTIKNEQLLQQLLQQQHKEKPEIMNAAAYKSNKLRGNKYRGEKDYYSEDDMTEAMIYSSGHNPTHTFNRPSEDVAYSGSIKALTVDDIWSQLQQQYLSKYTPQAQSLIAADSDEQVPFATTATKTKPKRKRNTKRHKHTSLSSWPVKTLSYHRKQQPKNHHQHYYDDIHSSPPSATAFSSGGSLSSHRDTDLFAKRPFNKFTAHNDEDETVETDEDAMALFDEEGDEDDVDVYGNNADNIHDESGEEFVYQRGKKYAGHTAYGHHSHTNNPFNYHDLYGSYSTPVTATVATHLQPSTFHPNLVSSTLPSYAVASSSNSFLPSLSHPSTSYQWRTQQTYPASYQTYHLQHQLQKPQHSTTDSDSEEHYAQQQSSALRLPKATITRTADSVSSFKLSPTQSNDFTVSSSSSASTSASSSSPYSSLKSTAPTTTRYKKRKNRIKTKRNRIVVI